MRHKYLYQLFADGDTAENNPETYEPAEKETGSEEKTEKQRTYTDEDVDRIIAARFAKWSKDQEKKITEAQKLATMTAQEKAEHERDQLQKELDEYKRKDTLAEMAKTAKGLLKDEEINAPDDIVAMLITDDAETTQQNVKTFATAFKSMVQEAVKAALHGYEPKSGSGSGGGLTKDKILAIKDPIERQKQIAQHMDLFQ